MVFRHTSSCDDSRLGILLLSDEHSDEFRVVAEHVESCKRCQQRLTALAADARSWSDVRELLCGVESGASPSPAPDTGGARRADGQVPLDFLASPAHPELLGRLGRYEIERVIGAGGMGVVLKGFDTELNRPVAIKVLAPHLAHNAAARRRFAREGRAAAAVVHEHVVAIHNVESDGEIPFLVMPYVAGESLQCRVDRQGPLGPKETLRIGIQAAAGLAAAHQQGLVHRDIKPGNILLETGVERALLTDFGLARAIDDASLTHTGVVAGTPHYMSPEQADGQPVDYRSDLFSLGSVLYFMATGHPPFRAERPMAVLRRICQDRHRPLCEVNPEMPEELSAIVDRLLDKRAARRPASAAAVQQSLAALLADVQQGRSSGHRFRRRVLARPRVLAVVSIAAVLAIVSISLPRLQPWPQRPVRESPRVDVASPAPGPVPRRDLESATGPSAADALGRLLLLGPAPQADYAAEAASIGGELSRWEASQAGGDSFLHHSWDAWQVELEAARRDALRLEQRPFPDLDPSGEVP